MLAFLLATGLGVSALMRVLGRTPGRLLARQRADLDVGLIDGIQGMADLLAFDQAGRQAARVQAQGAALGASQKRMAGLNGLQSALISLLTNLGMWTILVLAIPQVSAGQLNGVYLAVLTLAALASFEAVQPLPQAAQYLENNLEAARRLFEIAAEPPAVLDAPGPLPPPQAFDLQVDHLSFTYPHAPEAHLPAALQDLTFNLPEGQRLGIVGPSGSGKSTLVNLLLRFYEIENGAIRLGGNDIRGYRQDDVRQVMGVVAQKTYLFTASVRDNLLIARPGASQAEIQRATEAAQLHDFIQSLPEGYDTWIGDQGLRLSGGERQRLAIARALLQDPPFLILDEAMANLDSLTEGLALNAIHLLMQGRTTLMISHRLAGMQTMDEVLVLRQGRLIERGSHFDLLQAGGYYRKMWDLQQQVMLG